MRTFFILLITILSIQQVSAQYGRNSRYGRQQSQIPSTPPPQPDPVTAEEIVAERLPDYQAEFNLDNFEIEVLRNYLTDHIKEVQALQTDRTLKPQDAREAYDRLQTKLKENLGAIMTLDEVNKLIAMDFSPRAKRKRKKSKND
tara:strand:- start:451 stop:882 length:432 start_codon:yes stop_codon:yes gene_type:complete